MVRRYVGDPTCARYFGRKRFWSTGGDHVRPLADATRGIPATRGDSSVDILSEIWGLGGFIGQLDGRFLRFLAVTCQERTGLLNRVDSNILCGVTWRHEKLSLQPSQSAWIFDFLKFEIRN